MRKISTGDDSTLGTYRKLALLVGGEGSLAVKFLDKKIAEQGADQEVIAAEDQMIKLILDLQAEEEEDA